MKVPEEVQIQDLGKEIVEQLDILVCSIAVHFFLVICTLTHEFTGLPEYCKTRENIQRY